MCMVWLEGAIEEGMKTEQQVRDRIEDCRRRIRNTPRYDAQYAYEHYNNIMDTLFWVLEEEKER